MTAHYRVPARTGLAIEVDAGQRVAVVDMQGGQVGDLFAFNRQDLTEYLSASHTRAYNSRLLPAVGECFVSSRRRPMLKVLADCSPGCHDMLIAACDAPRYAQLGIEGWHASCADNLADALAATGRTVAHTPQPFNVFMRTPAEPDGTISWLPALTDPGDRFEMEALIDLVVVLSACPSDTIGINAGGTTDLALEVDPVG
jgi:hypothetical protein